VVAHKICEDGIRNLILLLRNQAIYLFHSSPPNDQYYRPPATKYQLLAADVNSLGSLMGTPML
jgi:hypothetical protein